MSPELIGSIGFLIMFMLMFLGMPIGFALALVGFCGQIFMFGLDGALLHLGMTPYAQVASFTLCVLPLFILMGEFSFASGITEGAYTFVHKLFGRLHGGVAISSIAACGIFAACTGSSIAGAATMAKIALPEMKRYRYDMALAAGSIAAGGTLGILIPPSNPMIIYSLLTSASIGKMFIAGVVPGLLLSGMFMLTIYLMSKFNPALGPPGDKARLSEIFYELTRVWPALILIVVILVGLWGGVFSPSEAGAVGALIAFLYLIWKKRWLSFKGVLGSLSHTTQTTAKIFMIVIGAMIFGDFMTLSNLPVAMAEMLNNFSMSVTFVIILLMLIYILLGMVMDELAICLTTLPVVWPVLSAMGVDAVWFGILFVITTQLGLITPPVGLIVFVLSGVAPDIPMHTVFKGVLPFAIVMVICLALLVIFPEIVMFLPGSMLTY